MLLHACTGTLQAGSDVAPDEFKTPEPRLSGRMAIRADEMQTQCLPPAGAYDRVLLPARPTCPMCFSEFSSLPALSSHLTGVGESMHVTMCAEAFASSGCSLCLCLLPDSQQRDAHLLTCRYADKLPLMTSSSSSTLFHSPTSPLSPSHSLSCDDVPPTSDAPTSSPNRPHSPPSPSHSHSPTHPRILSLAVTAVGGGRGGGVDLCGRVALVDENERVLVDCVVCPTLPVTDFRSTTSGLSPSDMSSAMPFRKARRLLLSFLRHAPSLSSSFPPHSSSLSPSPTALLQKVRSHDSILPSSPSLPQSTPPRPLHSLSNPSPPSHTSIAHTPSGHSSPNRILTPVRATSQPSSSTSTYPCQPGQFNCQAGSRAVQRGVKAGSSIDRGDMSMSVNSSSSSGSISGNNSSSSNNCITKRGCREINTEARDLGPVLLVGDDLQLAMAVLMIEHPAAHCRDISSSPLYFDAENRSVAIQALAERHLGYTIGCGSDEALERAVASVRLHRRFEQYDWL